jgi:hypothetical protein
VGVGFGVGEGEGAGVDPIKTVTIAPPASGLGSLIRTEGGLVYPEPALVSVTVVITPLVAVAVAVAPDPPPPEIVTVGEVNPVPPKTILKPVITTGDAKAASIIKV